MYVAVVISQLEEALQYEVKEIMVTGTIASIVHDQCIRGIRKKI